MGVGPVLLTPNWQRGSKTEDSNVCKRAAKNYTIL